LEIKGVPLIYGYDDIQQFEPRAKIVQGFFTEHDMMDYKNRVQKDTPYLLNVAVDPLQVDGESTAQRAEFDRDAADRKRRLSGGPQ
jgi:hypothetical protein